MNKTKAARKKLPPQTHQTNTLLQSKGDKVFDVFVFILTILIIVITLYPLIYVFSMAISNPISVARKEIWLWPVGFSFEAFKTVLNDSNLYIYYGNTFWYTIVGIITGIATTALAAYPLSRKNFGPRRIFLFIIMFTMFFGGGMIPTYLVVARFLHLYNSRWALILPGLTSAWYISVARNFFATLPEEMLESARVDGASEYRVFLQFVIPLSAPILRCWRCITASVSGTATLALCCIWAKRICSRWRCTFAEWSFRIRWKSTTRFPTFRMSRS